jgi:hypothetical protein
MADVTPLGAGPEPVAALPAAAPPPASLKSLSCPRCAGSLQMRDGERLLTCGHCGTSFLFPLENGFARRYFPAKVSRLEAVGKADAWLVKHPDVPRDIDVAVFTEAQLIYLPIWEARAYLVGWEFGKKLRTRAEVVRESAMTVEFFGGEQPVTTRLDLVEEGVQEGFFDERRMYQAAADLDALGMGRPHITGREFALPYLPGELESGAALLEADRDYEAVQAKARESFLRPSAGTITRDSRLFLLRESMTLLYYPLWVLKYRYRDRLYEMSVDGRSGVVHSARAPAENISRLAVMLASYAAMALALALAVSAWHAYPGLREVFFYVALLIVAASGGVFWRFRLVREVEYHEPFSY